MLLEHISAWEILYHLFDKIDDIVKVMDKSLKEYLLPKFKSKGGRPSGLSLAAILSFGIFRFFVGIKDIKHYHRYLLSYFSKELGNIPNYPNFNRLMNQALPWAIFLIQWLMHCQRKDSPSDLHFIDSTALKVCTNKRIFDHKVCAGLAQRGKTSLGYFFGFKLHMVCDALGRLVSLLITPGNTDDRKFVLKLLKGLKGLVVADAGYLSKKLMIQLFKQGILFLTGVRKNMKRLLSQAQHQILKLRQRAEGVFSVLKHRLNCEASIARSPVGYISRCIFPCLAYIFQPFFHQPSKLALSYV
jgi:hypothetical protein